MERKRGVEWTKKVVSVFHTFTWKLLPDSDSQYKQINKSLPRRNILEIGPLQPKVQRKIMRLRMMRSRLGTNESNTINAEQAE